jgi:hypothetical protein
MLVLLFFSAPSSYRYWSENSNSCRARVGSGTSVLSVLVKNLTVAEPAWKVALPGLQPEEPAQEQQESAHHEEHGGGAGGGGGGSSRGGDRRSSHGGGRGESRRCSSRDASFEKESCPSSYQGNRHRVGRVISFFSCPRNWDSPTPSPAGECASPPLWFRGEGHTRLRPWGLGESQFRRGDIHFVTLYIYVRGGNREQLYDDSAKTTLFVIFNLKKQGTFHRTSYASVKGELYECTTMVQRRHCS